MFQDCCDYLRKNAHKYGQYYEDQRIGTTWERQGVILQEICVTRWQDRSGKEVKEQTTLETGANVGVSSRPSKIETILVRMGRRLQDAWEEREGGINVGKSSQRHRTGRSKLYSTIFLELHPERSRG